MAREKLNIPRAKRPGFGEPNRSWLSGTFGSGSIKRKSLGNHHKVVTIWKIIPIGGLPTALPAAAATDDCFPSYFFFLFQIFCVLKATLINTDDNETKRFRFQCSVQLYTCFCLTVFPLTRNFHNGDDSFVLFVFFFNQFLFCYTQKLKKMSREYTFCFLFLASSIRKTRSLGCFFL